MSQPLRATSFAGIRVFRKAVSGSLIGVCAVVALWSISLARGGGGNASDSITANPNPLPTPLPNQKGRLTSTGNGPRRTTYEYDELGRPTRTVHNFEGQTKPFTTTFGLPQSQVSPTGLGTVPSSQTFPDNERVDYTYDAGGAQQSIKTTPPSSQQQTIIGSILRNSRGQTIAATYGNGAISIYKYNETTDLRLNQIKTAVGATLTINGGIPQLTGGATLQDYGYSFDSNGNVIGVADNFNPSLSATYGYDTLDQLISMAPAGQAGLTYTYDRIGNLTGKEGVTQSYYSGGGLGQGPHALASANGVTYSYDNNGNLVSTSNGTNITWNSENLPATVVQGGVTMYQKFFVGESLWKKVEPSGITYYLPSMRIENGQVRKFFGAFAERSPDGSLKFYHGDHLGSASLVTNSAGAMVTRQAYMPYGSDRSVDPNGSFTPKYQFNFKEKESTGFYDYGARLYNPATGRWLSADTNMTDGLNRYTYARNNPLTYIDPNGHQSGNSSEKKGVWAAEFISPSGNYNIAFFPGGPTQAAEHGYTPIVGPQYTYGIWSVTSDGRTVEFFPSNPTPYYSARGRVPPAFIGRFGPDPIEREPPSYSSQEKVTTKSIEYGAGLLTVGCTICSNGKEFRYVQLGPSLVPFVLRAGEGEPTPGLFLSGNLNNGNSEQMSYNINWSLIPFRPFNFSPYELATPNADIGVGLMIPLEFELGTPNLSGNTSADGGKTWPTPPKKIGVDFVNFSNLWLRP